MRLISPVSRHVSKASPTIFARASDISLRIPAKDTSPFELLLATRCLTPIAAITKIGKTRVGILRHYAPQTALAEYFSRPLHD